VLHRVDFPAVSISHGRARASKDKRGLAATALAFAALAVTAAPAAAAAKKECSRQATVEYGTVLDMTKVAIAADGTRTLDQTPVRHLKARHGYTTTAHSRLVFDGVVYTVDKGAIFSLSCFGHSKADGARFPSLELHQGEVAVAARADKPGAVSSNEGLFDPYKSKAMSFAVTRKAKGSPSFQEILAQGPSATRLGSTEARKVATSSASYLNVTPYVGEKRGVCRQASGGMFVSQRRKNGHLEGTSKFYGLAVWYGVVPVPRRRG